MSSATASDQQTPKKRVRIDDNDATIPDPSASLPDLKSNKPSTKTPLARASATVKAQAETLLPRLVPILTQLGEEQLSIQHRLLNKTAQLNRMESDESIVPCSARIEFTLSAPKKIQELPDYVALLEQTQNDVHEFCKKFKQRILQSLAIEIVALRAELVEHLAHAFYTAISAILISDGQSSAATHSAMA